MQSGHKDIRKIKRTPINPKTTLRIHTSLSDIRKTLFIFNNHSQAKHVEGIQSSKDNLKEKHACTNFNKENKIPLARTIQSHFPKDSKDTNLLNTSKKQKTAYQNKCMIDNNIEAVLLNQVIHMDSKEDVNNNTPANINKINNEHYTATRLRNVKAVDYRQFYSSDETTLTKEDCAVKKPQARKLYDLSKHFTITCDNKNVCENHNDNIEELSSSRCDYTKHVVTALIEPLPEFRGKASSPVRKVKKQTNKIQKSDFDAIEIVGSTAHEKPENVTKEIKPVRSVIKGKENISSPHIKQKRSRRGRHSKQPSRSKPISKKANDNFNRLLEELETTRKYCKLDHRNATMEKTFCSAPRTKNASHKTIDMEMRSGKNDFKKIPQYFELLEREVPGTPKMKRNFSSSSIDEVLEIEPLLKAVDNVERLPYLDSMICSKAKIKVTSKDVLNMSEATSCDALCVMRPISSAKATEVESISSLYLDKRADVNKNSDLDCEIQLPQQLENDYITNWIAASCGSQKEQDVIIKIIDVWLSGNASFVKSVLVNFFQEPIEPQHQKLYELLMKLDGCMNDYFKGKQF